jgi:DNA-binding NtrC family response regulator
MVREGMFREDLYYRLHVLSIELPPLRQRRDDLPLLIDHFLRRFFARRGMAVPPVSESVTKALLRYDWPGNVRELENTCERIAESCVCGRVGIGCVAASVLFHEERGVRPPAPVLRAEQPAVMAHRDLPPLPEATRGTDGVRLDEHLRRVERALIEWALAQSNGNKSRAAELLHIKRSTLGDRIARCRRTDGTEENGVDAASVNVAVAS